MSSSSVSVSAPSCAQASVGVTWFQGVNAATGAREVLPWADFLVRFHEPKPRETPKGRLGTWSGALFAGDKRLGANVEGVFVVGFDIDVEPVPDAESVRGAVAGVEGFFYSTSSSTPDKPRWRLYYRLSRPVDEQEYKRIWHEVASRIPFTVGKEAKDAARQWFEPREPSEGDYVFEELQGAPLDVDELLSSEPSAPSDATADDRTPSEDTDVRRKSAAAMLGAAWPERGRHAAQMALAGALIRDGWGRDAAIDFLCAVCHAAGDEDRPKRTQTVNDTIRAGKPTGWATLRTMLDAQVCDAARDMLARDTPDMDRWFDYIHDCHAGRAVHSREGWTEYQTTAPSNDTEADPWRDAADCIGAIETPKARLTTGFRALDAATRGGIPTGRFVIVGGAPGAGKTTWSVQLAYRWARAGIHVGIVACDEDPAGLVIRMGQLAGFERGLLEEDPMTRAAARQALSGLPLRIADGEAEGMTLERASGALERRARGAPSVLIVDSLQTVASEGSAQAKDARARIGVVVKALKRAAKVDGHLVLATCELARGAYRSTESSDQVDPLAAFKESGAIEYGCGLALVLKNRKGTQDIVDVAMPKNRMGAKTPFVLRQQGAGFVEVDAMAPDLVTMSPRAQKLLEAVDSFVGSPASRSVISTAAGGKRETNLKTLDDLVEAGVLEDGREGIRRAVGR